MTSFYSKRFHKLIVCIVLLLPQFALAENMKLEVILLQHRMVDDVVHRIETSIACQTQYHLS